MGRLLITGLLFTVIWVSGCHAAGELSRHKPQQGSCPICPAGPQVAPPPGEFNFYFLVRQWGPEFCHSGCTIQPDPDQFTLHGLWPNLDNACVDDFPEHCGSVDAFDLNALPNDTYQRMMKDWPSLRKSNECFWGHEWDCHGSCSNYTQAEYFSRVLDLHEQYDIKAALDAANISPSSSPINTQDVIDAIAANFSVEPILHCTRGGGKTFLNEVFLTVDQDFKVVDSSTVCQVHPCIPSATVSKANFCGDKLIYKVPQIIPTIPVQPCGNNKCQPKSGKCKP